MVEFCEKCGAIIMGKAGEEVSCPACGHSTQAKEEVTLTQKVEKKKELEVFDEESTQVHPIATLDSGCPKCGCTQVYYWSKQMRAGDEPETQFYKCTSCKHQWRKHM